MTSSVFTIRQAFALALEHQHAGRLPDAEEIYRQILEAYPGEAASPVITTWDWRWRPRARSRRPMTLTSRPWLCSPTSPRPTTTRATFSS